MRTQNEELQHAISVFSEPNKEINELYPRAELLINHLYQSRTIVSIEQLRYNIFSTSVYKSNQTYSLAVLPPTRSALQEHVKRTYYQI